MFCRTDTIVWHGLASGPRMLQLHNFIQYFCAYRSYHANGDILLREIKNKCTLPRNTSDSSDGVHVDLSSNTRVTANFFLKQFYGPHIGRLWRVVTKQCASDLCDVFAGLLIDASTSRGNFYWIWLELSLYHVYYRKLSLVTFLYVQRITDGNLLCRRLKMFL